MTNARNSRDSIVRSINSTVRSMHCRRSTSVWVGNHVEADAKGPFHVFVGGSPQRKGAEVVPASMSTLSSVTPSYRLAATRRRRIVAWLWPIGSFTPTIRSPRASLPTGFGTITSARASSARRVISVTWVANPLTHELLDWLAAKLVESGWRLKSMHKAIMMSRVYRQSSDFREEPRRSTLMIDCCGVFHRAGSRPKRSATRCCSCPGPWIPARAGPGFVCTAICRTTLRPTYRSINTDPDTYRRAVYHQNARAAQIDLMTDFDQPDCAFSTSRRAETTTPLQALTTLNHAFTLDMARAMAQRLKREAGDDSAAQVRRAFAICFGRQPNDDESRAVHRFDRCTWTCRDVSCAPEYQRVDLPAMNSLTDLSRRKFLGNVYTALAGMGLIELLSDPVIAGPVISGQTTAGQAVGEPDHPPKARRVLQIFCPGAASHMDLWEHKPSLEKWMANRCRAKRGFLRSKARTET